MNTSSQSDYKQPEFYRFNEDSLELVKYVVTKETSASHVLDLGAGCGIIGIELANILQPQTLTLVEMQKEFLSIIDNNVENFLDPKIKSIVYHDSFARWKNTGQYDLIVCNPPYFLPGHGKESPDKRKQICRTFTVDGWTVLLKLVEKSLSEKGRAYFVLRNDQRVLDEITDSAQELNVDINTHKELLFLKLSRLNID